jgi:mono/diheme cytochrome c family protein
MHHRTNPAVILGLLLAVPALIAPTLIAPTLAAPAPAPTPKTMVLRSVTVTVPGSDRTFPGGQAAAAANANCLICHSAGMVLNQPALTKAAWEAEVRKMIAVYKAPIQESAIAPIVAYLAQIKGTN